MEEANKLIGAGKKHLVMGNAVEAASVLQEACGMLAKTFGDTADECGEAFFWCGRALLDLARMENTVLGNALEGVPEDECEEGEKNKDSNVECAENVDEKARDELRAKVYDAMSEEKINGEKQKDGSKAAEGEEVKEGENMVGKEGEKGEDEQKSTPKKEKEEDEGVNGACPSDEENKENIEMKDETAEKVEGDSGAEEEEADDDDEDAAAAEEADGQDAKESDDEEVGNLQLAWEMLEVAKVIYKRKDTKEDQLMAAQAHLKLGEVSSESGNYSQALEDLQECLKLQEKHLEPDSRLLAETHYQLGLTHTLHCQYSLAIEHLQNATAVIKTRLDNLQKILDKAGDSSEEASEERKELEELRGLLPELKEKVEDAQEGLKSATAEPMKEVLNGGSAFSAPSVPNGDASSSTAITAKPTNGVGSTNGHASKAPVSDISHLVRKKRKPESPVKEGSSKKVKQQQEVEVACSNGEEEVHANKTELESQ